MRYAFALLTFGMVSGCQVVPLDASGRACPCSIGFVCVANQCVIGGVDAQPDVSNDVTSDAFDGFVAMDAQAMDAQAMDAQAMDAQAMDSQIDATVPRMDQNPFCPQATLCFDYEDRSIPAQDVCTVGAVVIDTTSTGFGMASLRIQPNNVATADCGTVHNLPAPLTDMWLRAWVRRRGSTTYAAVITTVASDTISGVSIRRDVSGGTDHTDLRAENTEATTATNLFPHDQWVCVEMQTRITGTQLQIELFTGGVFRARHTATVTGGTTIPAIALGGYSGSPNNFSLTFDNVVVSPTRVPCQ